MTPHNIRSQMIVEGCLVLFKFYSNVWKCIYLSKLNYIGHISFVLIVSIKENIDLVIISFYLIMKLKGLWFLRWMCDLIS
jgi:hypothetical protein